MDDADLVEVPSEDVGDLLPDEEGALPVGYHGDLFGSLWYGVGRLGLDVSVILVGRPVGLFNIDVRLRETLLGVALPYPCRERYVPSLVDGSCVLRLGRVYVEVGWKLVVLYYNFIHGLVRGVLVPGAHEGDGIPYEVDLLVVEEGLVWEGVSDLVVPGNVSAREDAFHTGHL